MIMIIMIIYVAIPPSAINYYEASFRSYGIASYHARVKEPAETDCSVASLRIPETPFHSPATYT